MKNVRLLVGTYLGAGVLTLVVIWFLRNDPAAVNDAVWMKIDQVVLGLVLVAVTVAVNSRDLRTRFATK